MKLAANERSRLCNVLYTSFLSRQSEKGGFWARVLWKTPFSKQAK